jgi:hypothetical protein
MGGETGEGKNSRCLCYGIFFPWKQFHRSSISQSMTRGVPTFSITPLRRNILTSASELECSLGGGDFLLLVFFLIQFPPGLWKNLKRSKWNTLELGGNWFMKKTRSKKSCDTVPLTWPCALYCMHYSVLSQKISSELIKSITAIQ